MKKLSWLLLIMPMLAILFTSCPYSSDVPIDEPSIKAERSMYGKWYKASEMESEHPAYYEFLDLDKFRYKLVNYTYSTTDSAYTTENYTAHFSKIDNLTFINLQKDGETTFLLYRLDMKGKDEFVLFEVTDNIDEKFTNSSELKEFMRKNMNLSFFYSKDEVVYKKKN